MPNETRQPIDITTLAWEHPTPESPLLFDPKVDITEEDWEKIETMLEAKQWYEDWLYMHYAYFAVSSSIQRKKELSLGQIPLMVTQDLKTRIGLNRDNWGTTILNGPRDAIFFKTLSPEEFSKLQVGPDDKTKLQETIKECEEDNRLLLKIVNTIALKALFPQETIRLSDDDWQKIKDLVKVEPQATIFQRKEFILAAKIFFPQLCHQLEMPGLSSRSQIQTRLTELREDNDWEEFLSFVYAIILLSAQKVEITDRGIELVFDRSEPFTQPTPPLPPVRRF